MVARGLAGAAVAELVDGDDPEAVGAVRVEAQLYVVEVPGHSLPLLPRPLLLLCVLLLPGLHDELWQKTETMFSLLPVKCQATRLHSKFPS